jgi:aspartyl-tRNA(Asn)/glutamyl-tRNA(Gln) amidotransferase subunit B
MQEGSMRVDANVNLHLAWADQRAATPIVEIKNLNSFRNVERALEFEQGRQLQAWQETGEQLGDRPKQTRGWDADREVTTVQREKEEAADYRYFPCPDLPPVTISVVEIERRRQALPRLPQQWKADLVARWKLTEYDAAVIVEQGREFAQYFEAVAAISRDGKRTANWCTQEIMRLLNENQQTIDSFPITAQKMGVLVAAVSQGELDHSRARQVFNHWFQHDVSFSEAKQQLGIADVDPQLIDALVRELMVQHAAAIEDYRRGKKQALGPIIAAAKQLNPNVNPGSVRAALLQAIES